MGRKRRRFTQDFKARVALAAARILRKLFGIGKPRALQGEGGLASLAYLHMVGLACLLAGHRRRESWGTVRLARLAA
jgi:hypothetical protein